MMGLSYHMARTSQLWEGSTVRKFTIEVKFYAEAGVFVGTSPDMPGLTLETKTAPQLVEVAADLVPELLRSNLGISESERYEIRFKYKNGKREKTQPRYILDDEFTSEIAAGR